jgi:hypothetical protein
VKKFHFVYNVDATATSLMMDFIHRIVDPETYPCRLCDLTYGRFIKKKSWRDFVAGLPVESVFHLRGGFRRLHPEVESVALPAVFVEDARGHVKVLITAARLRRVKSQAGLEKLVAAEVSAVANAAAANKVSRSRARRKTKASRSSR